MSPSLTQRICSSWPGSYLPPRSVVSGRGFLVSPPPPPDTWKLPRGFQKVCEVRIILTKLLGHYLSFLQHWHFHGRYKSHGEGTAGDGGAGIEVAAQSGGRRTGRPTARPSRENAAAPLGSILSERVRITDFINPRPFHALSFKIPLCFGGRCPKSTAFQ